MNDFPDHIKPGQSLDSQLSARKFNNLIDSSKAVADMIGGTGVNIDKYGDRVIQKTPARKRNVSAPPAQYFARVTGYSVGNQWFMGRRISVGGEDIDQTNIEIKAIKLPNDSADLEEMVPKVMPSEEFTPESMVVVMAKGTEWWVCNAIFQWTCFDDEGE